MRSSSHKLHNKDVGSHEAQPIFNVPLILRALDQAVEHDPVSEPIWVELWPVSLRSKVWEERQ
jgi:hypothetical protein